MKHLPYLALSAMILVARPAFAADKSEAPLTFEQHIRPLLKAHCFECHGEGQKLRGGLDLRLRRLIVKGGDSGAAIAPGKRDDSLLFERVHQGEMPPSKKKLTREEIDRIGRWIAEGAKTAKPEPAEIVAGLHITEEERSFWAFQPIRRPAVPEVRSQKSEVRNPVDAFLLLKLQEKGLSFAPEADRATLIRRVTFDLLGLPTTPEEVARFVADDRPDAYERLIDRLLASPHYGERWGRHWLDVAGYADSDGYTSDDAVRNYAFKYRDYVIRAFNNDKPWDQFIQEQLAGDEMLKPPYTNLSPPDLEKLIATGFLRLAPDGTGAADVDQSLARNAVMADTIKIVSTSLLGLTVGCAQCHNHRYDPIPQTDYYRMRAIFEPAYDWKNWRTPQNRLIALATDADRAKAKQIEAEAVKIDQERLKKQDEFIEQTLEKELAKLPEELREPIRAARKAPVAKQTPAQKQLLKDHPSVNVSAGSLYLYDRQAANELLKYTEKAAALRATKPVEDFVMALTEVPGKVPPTHLFERGDHEQPKQVLTPGTLTILEPLGFAKIPEKDAALPTTGRRLAFARGLTDGKHPLTARVLVNRFWMHHFGRGIVGSPGDFGILGERPTHPELLDWLASEFMAPSPLPLSPAAGERGAAEPLPLAAGERGRGEGGWRLKSFHKLILTSTAYRQSSLREAAKDRIDPDNHLLGRMSLRRLEAEAVRDAILSVSGRLNSRQSGPAVPIMVDDVGQFVLGVDTRDGAGRPTGKVVALNGDEHRRSVFVQVRRSRPLSVLETFDLPSLEPNCEARNSSTVTPQSLLLMNSIFIVAHAADFAQRVKKEVGDDPQAQVERAWRLAFAREPSAEEIKQAVVFLEGQQKQFSARPDPQMQALASFCQALLSTNRFLYVD